MYIGGFWIRKNGKVVSFEVGNKDFVKAGLLTALYLTPNTVLAEGEKKSISESLQPLIQVLQDLAEPVSYGFMIKGFMQIMAGNEHTGKKTIKHSASGFLGIQFLPDIFRIIKNIRL